MSPAALAAGWPWPHSVTCTYLHVGRRSSIILASCRCRGCFGVEDMRARAHQACKSMELMQPPPLNGLITLPRHISSMIPISPIFHCSALHCTGLYGTGARGMLLISPVFAGSELHWSLVQRWLSPSSSSRLIIPGNGNNDNNTNKAIYRRPVMSLSSSRSIITSRKSMGGRADGHPGRVTGVLGQGSMCPVCPVLPVQPD